MEESIFCLKHGESTKCSECVTEQLQADSKNLKEFARRVINAGCWESCELDGGDLQELAKKLGLIVPHIATEADIDDEPEYEVGDTIYRFSDVLNGGA